MNIRVNAYWGIGDVILQTPAIALIKSAAPDARIYHNTMEVLLHGKNSVVRYHPDVFAVDEPVQATAVDVNFGGYQFYPPEKVAEYHRDFKHTHIFCDMAVKALEAKDIAAKHLMPAADKYLYPEMFLLAEDRAVVPPKTDRKRIVLCRAHKGCEQKVWPEKKWQQLAQALYKVGFELVVVGRAGKFHFDCAQIDLVGKLTFRQTAAVQTSADVYIGHGDGLIVSAYALHVPFVCLWGAFAQPDHYFDMSRPWVKTLGKVMPCSYRFTTDYLGWLNTTCTKPPGNPKRCECIRDIKVEEVVEAVRSYFK